MGLWADTRSAWACAWSSGIDSPFGTPHPHHLESVVWADILGQDILDKLPVTRATAMRVPAMARARNLICGTIAQLPLVAERGGQDATAEHPWLGRTDRDVSMYHLMVWTIDDLLFHGWSLWKVDRTAERRPAHVWRIAAERWQLDASGRLTIDGQPVNIDDSLCLIPGINEGLLAYAADAIRQATNLSTAAGNAAYAPSPTMELHYTGNTELTDTQIDALIARWAAARRGQNGGVAYTNKVLETKEHGAANEHLLIEGRNAAAVDIARAANIPAAMIDAASGDSLTYKTTEGKITELIDFGCAPLMAAISARLSLDDMVPRGTVVRFDREQFIGAQRQTAADPAASEDPAGARPPLRVVNEGGRDV